MLFLLNLHKFLLIHMEIFHLKYSWNFATPVPFDMLQYGGVSQTMPQILPILSET